MPNHSPWPPKPPTGSLRVPNGFSALMEVFLGVLVTDKPGDPFKFGAEFFARMVRVRRDTGYDPTLHGAQARDAFTGVVTEENGDNKDQQNGQEKNSPPPGDATDSDTDHDEDWLPGESGVD